MKFSSVLSAAGTLAVASAASSNSCSFSKTTITAATAVSQLNSCPTLDGDIQISGDQIGAIDFSSVKEIAGDVKLFNSSSVTEINLNQLKKISGSLSIDAYTQLHAIDFTSLTEAQKLSLVSLPSLALLNLNSGISKAGTIEVSDTALSSLRGLTNFNTVGVLNVNNNKNISSIDLAGLDTVSENLILSFNSDHCEIKLDDLAWASNLTIQDVSELSASNLTSVNGSLQLAYNNFNSVDLSSLKQVGGSVLIFANDELTDVDLGSLKEIGGELRLMNNTDLEDLGNTFKKLEEVKGAVNIRGAIANFTLPSLDKVDGDFSFSSTSDEFDCSDLKKQRSKGDIEGHNFNCSAPTKSKSSSSSGSKSSTKGGSSSTDSSSSGSSSSDSKKSNGASTLYTSMMVVSCGVAAALAIII
ncbi:uncharacterized protein CANTADRAFT_52583 [Suhomyces tanzawaensis NRRL Y-17324]|uniref:Uncharacterized protein n=1 Tax=Suhomyces tanzawaensis NRRL Y-17324 TaxID=984487 RepID=A0A1E4SGX9_9ASCO|nr:uncharacterized protein CANTADRAFT_52583 [Suhomyces tanzawaensis NRRL Y-17324]ODV78672.1 hypothetical protein CANTADRAFT_52583 [Suhomyces tanzawaensis NRRL Y-17324]